MTWQPIKTAPKDGTQIVLFLEDKQCAIGEYVTQKDGFAAWELFHTEDSAYYLSIRATHWMPLPEPPDEA